jgi:hypothetical protein
MRARSLSIIAVLAVSLVGPAAATAQSGGYLLLVDNERIDCDLPLPAVMVTGELGTTIFVSEDTQVDEVQIDKVTLSTTFGAEVLDAQFRKNSREAEILVSTDVASYIVWSCAPLNGEPVLQNDPNEV